MLFFTFIKGGVTPLTGPPNLNGFSSIIRGGGVKSLLTNVNKKMFFFNEGFPNQYILQGSFRIDARIYIISFIF